MLLLWKKKLSKTWGISLLACALVIAGAGGIGVVRQIQNRAEEYGNIYLALCYLERGQTDPAALYLKRVTNQTGYHLTAAQTLLEQMRGNNTVAKLRLDVLEHIQDGSEEQSGGIERLRSWQQMDGIKKKAKLDWGGRIKSTKKQLKKSCVNGEGTSDRYMSLTFYIMFTVPVKCCEVVEKPAG